MWTEIWKRQYLWGIKLSLFFSLSMKEHQPALHYHHNDKNIIIIIITSSMLWLLNTSLFSFTTQWAYLLHNAAITLHTSYILHWRHIAVTVFLRAWVSWRGRSIPPPPPSHPRTQLSSYLAECWCTAVLYPEDRCTHINTQQFRGEILQQWKVRRLGGNPDSRMAIHTDLHTTD